MEPSVGRIVHYQSYGTPKGEYLPEARAAIITQVGEHSEVGLCVVNPTGLFFPTAVPYGVGPGKWTWPPRV